MGVRSAERDQGRIVPGPGNTEVGPPVVKLTRNAQPAAVPAAAPPKSLGLVGSAPARESAGVVNGTRRRIAEKTT